MISILVSLPVTPVNAILLGLQTLTAIPMENVPAKVATLVTNVINAKVDTTKSLLENVLYVSKVQVVFISLSDLLNL